MTVRDFKEKTWSVALSPIFLMFNTCYLAVVCYMRLRREKIVLLDDGFVLRRWPKKRKLLWQDIAKIRRLDGPPMRSYELHCSNGVVLALNPFAETKALMKMLSSKGILIETTTE